MVGSRTIKKIEVSRWHHGIMWDVDGSHGSGSDSGRPSGVVSECWTTENPEAVGSLGFHMNRQLWWGTIQETILSNVILNRDSHRVSRFRHDCGLPGFLGDLESSVKLIAGGF